MDALIITTAACCVLAGTWLLFDGRRSAAEKIVLLLYGIALRMHAVSRAADRAVVEYRVQKAQARRVPGCVMSSLARRPAITPAAERPATPQRKSGL